MPRWAVAVVLAVVTLAVYAPVRGHGFVDYDDGEYVFANPHVQAGLSAESVAWAFTTMAVTNWHPLTWLSHMLDVQLFGLDPAGHHLVNVVLHAANAGLLLFVLNSLTGRLWPSALVAALFALHPLNVETVAWVAERKNVLCTFFTILALAAYGRYARRPGPGRYALVAAGMVLALLAKPMAVTLPLMLLLLDFWPLGRLRRATALRLCVEKLPLVVLAALSSAVTLQAHVQAGTVITVEHISAGARLANAVVSYLAYIGKLAWPARLGVFYPHRELTVPIAQVAAAALVLLGVTAAVVRAASRAPYLAVGWLWYVVTLLPVIGIVQVGTQSMADRYAYVPAIGLFIAVAWAADSLAARRPAPRAWAAAAGVVLCALAARTVRQVPVWQDSLSLFSATVAAVPDSWVGHYNLGNAYAAMDRQAEAEAEYRETVRLRPRFARAHNNLGNALDAQGRHEEAVAAYDEAIRSSPLMAEAHNNLGTALAATGRLEEAAAALRRAIGVEPRFAEAYVNLGVVLRRMGRLQESAAALAQAVMLRPDLDFGRYQRAVTALEAGDAEGARRDLDVLRYRDARLAGLLGEALQRGAAGASGTAEPAPAPPRKP
jgi:tetratricopeptide (TPR) repeat protein